jgi:integrase/recombinase XerC
MDIAALAWVGRFQRFLVTERRVSPHTASAYELDVAALVRFCDAHGIASWQKLAFRDARLFAAKAHASGLSPASVRRRISAVRTFLWFLVREGALASNPTELLQGPKKARRLPDVLTVEQMAQLLDIPGDHPTVVRDRAIMELLYSSALRLIELIRLDLRDLDLAAGLVRVLGKRNVARIVPVGSYAVKALRWWLMARRGLAKPDDTALFVSRNGERLTPRGVQKRIGEWAQKQKIPFPVHPHMFRHSCATHVLESGADLRGVQELLGHASISNTAIYTHLNFERLAKVYGAAHPRARGQHDRPPADGAPPLSSTAHNFLPRVSLNRDCDLD